MWKNEKVIRGTIVSKCTWVNNLVQYIFDWIATLHSVDGKTKSDFARRHPKTKKRVEKKRAETEAKQIVRDFRQKTAKKSGRKKLMGTFSR